MAASRVEQQVWTIPKEWISCPFCLHEWRCQTKVPTHENKVHPCTMVLCVLHTSTTFFKLYFNYIITLYSSFMKVFATEALVTSLLSFLITTIWFIDSNISCQQISEVLLFLYIFFLPYSLFTKLDYLQYNPGKQSKYLLTSNDVLFKVKVKVTAFVWRLSNMQNSANDQKVVFRA